MKSTTARTKKLFESKGFIVAVVEKWNPHVGPQIETDPIICPECEAQIPQTRTAGIRQDLFGFADLIAYHPNKPDVILLQSTSGGNHASRVTKILENFKAREWVRFVCRSIAVVSYTKRKGKWKARIQFIDEGDYGGEAF